jgi:hypothetical protein
MQPTTQAVGGLVEAELAQRGERIDPTNVKYSRPGNEGVSGYRTAAHRILGIHRGTVRRYSSYDSPNCRRSVGSS